jgi:hypothetical protein
MSETSVRGSQSIPPGLRRTREHVMTNMGYSINAPMVELIDTGEYFGQYAGWNFCGYVWKGGDTYKCEVWHYGSPERVVEGTLEEIMKEVSDAYGYE